MQKQKFKFKKTGHRKWKYQIEQNYKYQLKSRLQPSCRLPTKTYIKSNKGSLLAQLTCSEIYLYKGYRWDGNTYGPDCEKSLRASAVHDVWCQLMRDKQNRNFNTWKNWLHGAKEYRCICNRDSLSKLWVIIFYLAIYGYGIFKKCKGKFTK